MVVFAVFIFAYGENFMTEDEYGALLYENPRGIGCNRCHGKNGEGSLIANYKEYNKTSDSHYDKELIAPPINRLSLQEFANGINSSKSVMPSYFLTEDEIIILYKFIKNIDKKEKK